MVELHPAPEAPRGWRPVPIEVKRGRSKNLHADRVQVCAQALCLEEAFSAEVSTGWIFYASSHRRTEVSINGSLRDATLECIRVFRAMRERCLLPSPSVPESVCRKCSLRPLCLPSATRHPRAAMSYLEEMASGRL
jgi:CRISPR-associated exonuclease Cas4